MIARTPASDARRPSRPPRNAGVICSRMMRARDRVGQHALEPVADLDAQLALVRRDREDHAVVEALLPDPPRFGDVHRILLDRHPLEGRRDVHHDLVAGPAPRTRRATARASCRVSGASSDARSIDARAQRRDLERVRDRLRARDRARRAQRARARALRTSPRAASRRRPRLRSSAAPARAAGSAPSGSSGTSARACCTRRRSRRSACARR